MVSNNNMSVKSEGEIPEHRKDDYINGISIHQNFLDLFIEHVSENNEGKIKKRDLTENERKLSYYIMNCTDNFSRGFNNITRDIHKYQHEIISEYTKLLEVKQYRASEELNEQLTRYKRNVTRHANKVKHAVENLVFVVNEKRQYTEALLFYQEVNDIFDEIKFGHVTDYDSDYLKIAGYGHYRNDKKIESYKRDSSYDVKRIHEIINNPHEAQSSEQIMRENLEFFKNAGNESKQFISDNISQKSYDSTRNSYLDIIYSCKHCDKEFKSGGNKLSNGKAVKSILNHLDKEHKKNTSSSWNIRHILEDAI